MDRNKIEAAVKMLLEGPLPGSRKCARKFTEV